MKKRIKLLTTSSAFLSVSFTVVLFAILSLNATYDRHNGNYGDPSGSTMDTEELSQSMLQASEKDILFIENLGQIKDTKGEKRPDILFLTRSEGVDMYMTNSGMTYVFRKIESDINDQSQSALSKNTDIKAEPNFYRLDMEFVGMNEHITVKKELAVDQQYHYYTPEYPDGISPRAYKKLTIENLYEGIDLVYYEKEGRMKYDFILKAGADAGKIKMKYKGASSMDIDKEGSVIITTPMGEIREEKPYTYSESTGMEIKSKYQVENNTVLFDVAEYEKSEDIIIDPVRMWATYYGGDMGERARSICTDNSGNIYLTGRTHSTDFPTQTLAASYNQTTYGGGTPDAFILKFNSNGERIWATYYGGSDRDEGNSIITDNLNNLYVTGETQSTDFPTQSLAGAYNQTTLGDTLDVFILKFDSNGVRQWATYYGGNDLDRGFEVCTDNSNNLYVTGETHSTDFPTQTLAGAYNQTATGGSSDLFILKFNSNGVRQWATYYGGSDYDGRAGSFWYSVGGMCTDGSGNLYVTGSTLSTDFPLQSSPGAYYQSTLTGNYTDAFILKFDSSGARQWATYYGGSVYDGGCGIVTDSSGGLYVTGYTYSNNDFPTQYLEGAYNQSFTGGSETFILKFDSNGVRLWATCYGGIGTNNEIGHGIAIDNSGNLYIVGGAQQGQFPSELPTQTLPGAYNQTTHGGGINDAFILMFNSNGERLWATFYGGSGAETAWGCCTDNSGNFYVTGHTSSDTFPLQTLPGAYNQTTLGGINGNNDLFILRFYEIYAAFSASDCAIGAGDTVTFTDQSSSNINSWNWTFEGGTPGTSTAQNPVVTYDTLGSYDVQLIVSDGTLSDTLLEDYLITVHGTGPSNCASNIDFFPADPLTHQGTGSNSTTLSFSPPRWDIAFTISDISQKLNGNPSRKYIEKVIVSYIDCSGQNQTYGTYSASSVSSANISIQDVVQSVTVTLTDDLDGNSGPSTMSVSLDTVSSCTAPGTGGCPDADGDGVCDANDICPGYDDNIDTDGDGIPDGCDNCTSVSNVFPDDPLTHSGPGSSSTSYDYGTPGHTDVSFVVSGLGAKINGNPNNRYIDQVTITYTDAGGNQTYGTFSGDNTSTVNVDIAGPVHLVTVTLNDGYDGEASGTLSVNPGSISSCPPAAAKRQDNDLGKDSLDKDISDFSVYPSPANELLTIRYQLKGESKVVKGITDINGNRVYDLNSLKKAGIQLDHIDVSQLPAGLYFLHLRSEEQEFIRKFVIMR